MMKIIIKNLLTAWFVLFTTNLIVLFLCLWLGIIQYTTLVDMNTLFWALYFGMKTGKEMREFKDAQDKKEE